MGFRASTCPYCACGCGLLLEQSEGRLVGAYPASGHPISKGRLCIRGWNSTDSWRHPDRLLTPLLRTGRELAPASPEEAVGLISDRLAAARSSSGGVCFAVTPAMSNEDLLAVRRLATHLQASVIGVDLSGAPAAHRALVGALGRRFCSSSIDALDSADLIWILGADLVDCPQVASRVNEAESRGARLVSFDVHSKPEKAGRAHVFVPAADFLLVSLLLEKAALEKASAPDTLAKSPGFQELSACFRDASWIPSRPDLDEPTIKGLCEELAATPNSAVIVGERWLTTGPALEQTVQLLQALAVLGADERVLFPVGESNSWGLCSLIADRQDQRFGLEDFLRGAAPEISVLFVCGDDLLGTAPRPDLLARLFSSAESLFVIDRFVSETLNFADAVLPSCGFAEIEGTVTSAFGSLGRWRQVVPPPGHAASERVWLGRIARAIGAPAAPETPLECWQSVASLLPPDRLNDIRKLYETDGSWLTWREEEKELRFVLPEITPREPWPQDWPDQLFLARHPANWKSGAVTSRDEILKRESVDRVLSLSPGDLKSRGIKPGAKAVLETPHGAASFVTREDPRLSDGVVFVEEPPGSNRCVPGFAPGSARGLSYQPAPCRVQKT
jgi:predicted molibdopterin-dependent oxidoreductase YjgC